jgi:hypothetical protein
MILPQMIAAALLLEIPKARLEYLPPSPRLPPSCNYGATKWRDTQVCQDLIRTADDRESSKHWNIDNFVS